MPAAGDLTLTTTGGGAVTISIADGGANGDTFVLYLVDITTGFTTFPTFTLTTTGWKIRDVDNVLGGGGTLTLTLETRDAASSTVIDPGAETKDWLKSALGVDVESALSETTAGIDVTNTTFVAIPPDTSVRDNGATVGIDSSVTDVLGLDGAAYTLVKTDTVELVVSGDLSGIASIVWDPQSVAITLLSTDSGFDITNGIATVEIEGDDTSVDGSANEIRITVDGITTLAERTLSITVDLVLSGDTSGPSDSSRTLVTTTTLTTWSVAAVDGVRPETTISEGPSGTISEINVTFTFTGSDNVTPVESLVYASRLDPLEPNFSAFSSSTSRSYSDLVPGDYTFHVKARDEAGNEDLTPASQSFTVSPATLLVANFTNGNNAAFNSRVYLWNPSSIAGDVTVRVFTLPLISGAAQELTITPHPLGTLGAKSALNIKLAEDILIPLGIPTPYTTDGGNLTLEISIQAANVGGIAQVFSSDFAFGTYPLVKIPSTSAGSPTVLVANFMNGNNATLNSRVYLWNPSASAGTVTVRVFTLPLSGGLAQELTTTPFELGTLEGKSALNIKLAEDILTPLGIPLPYTANGGNLTVEFSIQAADVVGAAQVFESDFAFGTYSMQEIPATSTGSPTVLVANFTNGNSAAFNSRVYLWNPSASAGNVTVRVFTLPLAGGQAQELTTEPFELGSLAAKSGLNVKLAEDILTPLGIPLPYTTDGGNLTLEITIQAADVRGAAQVFESDFAFGTYPMQQIPSTSSGVPTVLAANFMNGNNAVLNSRVYLWNPSLSPGDVTVRVFTLPLAGGQAQELTTEPFALGSLGAKSARNVKLVEDILIPLGIPTPYTTDGGNLTLEFTIQAADVTGAAQVFSSSFAFGTVPLQVIQ